MYKVALVGHSQIPIEMPEIPGTELRIFRQPGAKLEDIYKPPLRDVFEYRPDLCILYLGGNDLALPNTDRMEVMRKLREVLLSLKEVTKDLRWVNLEERFYPRRNRHQVIDSAYEADRKWFLNNIRRFLAKNTIGTLNVTGPWWARNQTDGIHFNRTAQRHIRTKFINCIVDIINSYEYRPHGTAASRFAERHPPGVANVRRRNHRRHSRC